jgi:hypothetical protein
MKAAFTPEGMLAHARELNQSFPKSQASAIALSPNVQRCSRPFILPQPLIG